MTLENKEFKLEWIEFVNKCKNIDISNTLIKSPPPKYQDGYLYCKENVTIDLNNVIGSMVKTNITWYQLLKQYRYKHSDSMKKLKQKASSSLNKQDYSLYTFGNSNKYYLSDGHNRFTFLKFYTHLYSLSTEVTVSKIYYYNLEEIDMNEKEESPILAMFSKYFKR